MEPLSEAALGVLRDKTIGDYLHAHCCGTTVFSKLAHGQQLLDHCGTSPSNSSWPACPCRRRT